jgi:hypothetical protein
LTGLGYVALVLIYAWLIPKFFSGTTPEGAGQFGDMFGAFNAFFSGLAFLGVIYTVWLQTRQVEMQSNEIRLQSEQLALQVEELRLQREEVAGNPKGVGADGHGTGKLRKGSSSANARVSNISKNFRHCFANQI